jgi:hypothetical protein
MDFTVLEQKYSSLLESLSEPSSNRIKQLKIIEYVDSFLSLSNPNLLEAYLIELLPEYIYLIKSVKIRGLDPSVVSSLLDQVHKIRNLKFTSQYHTQLDESLIYLTRKYEQIISWLNNPGKDVQDDIIYFPVIEKISEESITGFLEIIRIEISRGENQFFVEPYSSDIDYNIQEQIHFCWNIAISYCKKYLNNINSSHTVRLIFENRLGIYKGSSLGSALTFAFIEAILKHYNAPVIINTKGIVALSGGIDRDNNIISIGYEFIEKKVETVFYSDTKLFCIPKVDEVLAEEKLKSLSKIYPKRNLKIIGIEDLEDLLSRRNIVEIKKYNWFERTLRYIINKWQSFLIASIFSVILLFIFAIDFDDNPIMFEQDGKLLNIQNKNGKVLWTARLNFDPKSGIDDRRRYSRKIVDINGDGINEVILAEEELDFKNYDTGRVVCFDKDKNLIWEYYFRDTVSTFRKWTNNYQISIIDTSTLNGTKLLFLVARNIPNFANAIFKLELLTGKRFDSLSTLWNAGGITNAMIGDFNEDNKKEMIVAGLNNGFERAVLFSVDLDKLIGQTPSPERYIFNNLPKAELNKYILIPNSDYGKLYHRSNLVPFNGLYYASNSKEIVAQTLDGNDKPILFYYGFDTDLNFLWVDCADNAQQLRDSLVMQGILNHPLTNTEEYFKILEESIEYLN